MTIAKRADEFPQEHGRSYIWYDLETTGTEPKWDRIIQFAGIRTDLELNEVGDPLCTYIKCPIDVLPNPLACAVTGLTPQRVNRDGMNELEALVAINRLLAQPKTCVAGFNNLRFDDEFLRYGFYRHFIDPYAREWQGGNSRWDIIDLARAAAALRPDGIEWPRDEGLPSFRLEDLAAANGISHGSAHDALSDVRATIGLARLLRSKQPRLFNYYLALRDRDELRLRLRPERPQVCLHVSRMFARERGCIAPIMPLARHPRNKNSIIVADLGRDEHPLLEWDVVRLQEGLFGSDAEQRPGLKEVRLNRCPFVAPMKALRPQDITRLDLDVDVVQRRFDNLRGDLTLAQKISAVYAGRPHETATALAAADAGLYAGFIDDADRSRCADTLGQLLSGARAPSVQFDDERLTELLFRLRARRDDGALDAAEQIRWWTTVKAKLVDGIGGGLTLREFRALLDTVTNAPGVVAALNEHASNVEGRLRGAGVL
jgi:exodeoxyribonuclease-1